MGYTSAPGQGDGDQSQIRAPTKAENDSSPVTKASKGVKKLTGTSIAQNPLVVVSYKVVLLCGIWRPRDRYLCRPKPPTDTVLSNFVGRKAIASILGTGVYFKTSIRKWHENAVVLMLPAALSPTWEMLWREGREVALEVIIEGGES